MLVKNFVFCSTKLFGLLWSKRSGEWQWPSSPTLTKKHTHTHQFSSLRSQRGGTCMVVMGMTMATSASGVWSATPTPAATIVPNWTNKDYILIAHLAKLTVRCNFIAKSIFCNWILHERHSSPSTSIRFTWKYMLMISWYKIPIHICTS